MTLFNTNTTDIDLISYGTPLRFSARHGLVLSAQLIVSAPARPSARLKTALQKVSEQAEHVRLVLAERAKSSPGGLRPLIADLDGAWGALNGRLNSASKLPVTINDFGVRASALTQALFPDGLAFLVNEAEIKYAESARRLKRIEDENLRREIDRIAGPGFFEHVEKSHSALGEGIGVGTTPIRFVRGELLVATRALAEAIADYGLQSAAALDRDDPESVAAFRAAMMPIDRFRADRVTGEELEEEGEDEEGTEAAPPPATTPAIPTTPSTETEQA